MDLYSHFGLTEQALTGIHGAHSPCQIDETYKNHFEKYWLGATENLV